MTKSKNRTKATGEVFTPLDLVKEIIDQIYDGTPSLFLNKNKIFLDPACGDGEFLQGVIRKLKEVLKLKFTRERWEYAIQFQLLGIDLMWDNTCDTVYYLLRSWNEITPQPLIRKEQAYLILQEFRGNESRQQVLQRLGVLGYTVHSAETAYSWSNYSPLWVEKHVPIQIPKQLSVSTESGHVIDNMSPDKINSLFVSRTYTDTHGTITIRPQKDSKHYVEYSIDDSDIWIPVENIVRANSLTEWIFEEWKPKITQESQLANLSNTVC